MCGSTRSGSSPRTRAAWSPPSWRASSPATSNTISPPTSRSSSTTSPTTSSPGTTCCATSGATSSARSTRSRTCASPQVIDALDEMLAPHLFPPRADGTDPRQCPNCGTGRLSLKLGKFGAFIGCSNYPECRYHPPALGRRPTAAPTAACASSARIPTTGLEVTLRSGRFGPYVQLGEARSTARSRSAPACRRAVRPTTSTSTARSSCCRCRARSASIRTTASRSSPASAASDPTCSTARPTPISRPATTCSPSASTAR